MTVFPWNQVISKSVAMIRIGWHVDCVISELCYKGTILQRNYRKMTILWSFSCNSFVKFQGKKMGATTRQCYHVISKSVYNEVCYKETALHLYSIKVYRV